MALQSKMSWKMLAEVFDGIIPSFEEAKQVINILLMELEKLQLKLMEKEGKVSPQNQELKMCRNVDSSEDTQTISLGTETMPDVLQENELLSFVKETETTEDEIKILEVVKESINEEMYFDMSENPNPYKKYTNDEHDSGEIAAEESLGEIDNEWYTFVKNTNTSEPDTELLKEKESENNTESSNSTEYVNHVTIDELDSSNKNAVNLVMKMDHEWNTLDKHD